MKRTLLLFMIIFISMQTLTDACVGRVLNIGIVHSANENLMAEFISVLISERTGSAVNIKFFDDPKDIYDAVKQDEIGIIIENTHHAIKMLNIKRPDDLTMAYDLSKKAFRERLNLIWLKPFGILPADNSEGHLYYSAVITENVLINFPALPRVINKLRNISDDKQFTKLLISAGSGTKIKRIVRDFLKKKKLI